MTSPNDAVAAEAALEKAVKAGVKRVEREKTPSPEDVAFKTDQERNKTFADLEKLQLANENERAMIGLRKMYGQNMIRFLWVYFVVTFLLISLAAVHMVSIAVPGLLPSALLSFPVHFDVPQSVQAAMIGGTAVSVLGVVGTIVAGLFRVRG